MTRIKSKIPSTLLEPNPGQEFNNLLMKYNDIESWIDSEAPNPGQNSEHNRGVSVHERMTALPPILIVDDDSDDLFILKHVLTKAGVENAVVAFQDATAALSYLVSENKRLGRLYVPCIVFTDFNMPRLSGAEFIQAIRHEAGIDQLPIIVVSNSEDPRDLQAARTAGANRFLIKYPGIPQIREIAAEFCCKLQ